MGDILRSCIGRRHWKRLRHTDLCYFKIQFDPNLAGTLIVKALTTQKWGRKSVWFRDPDGNIVNFYMDAEVAAE